MCDDIVRRVVLNVGKIPIPLIVSGKWNAGHLEAVTVEHANQRLNGAAYADLIAAAVKQAENVHRAYLEGQADAKRAIIERLCGN